MAWRKTALKKDELINRIAAMSEQIFTLRMSQPITDEWPNLDLTFAQLRVLFALAGGPKRMSDLVETFGTQSSTMSATVDRLVIKGLVERSDDPQDRRVVLCMLSEQGLATYQQFARLSQVRFEKLAEFLSEDEMEIVAQAMAVILRAHNQVS